jgi:hypothetical protein
MSRLVLQWDSIYPSQGILINYSPLPTASVARSTPRNPSPADHHRVSIASCQLRHLKTSASPVVAFFTSSLAHQVLHLIELLQDFDLLVSTDWSNIIERTLVERVQQSGSAFGIV